MCECPSGLSTLRRKLQRMMTIVLQNINNCFVYIDDIIIYSLTIEDHLAILRKVLARLNETGLTIKTEKCHWLQSSIDYLGHIISYDSIKMNPNRVEAYSNTPTPHPRLIYVL